MYRELSAFLLDFAKKYTFINLDFSAYKLPKKFYFSFATAKHHPFLSYIKK